MSFFDLNQPIRNSNIMYHKSNCPKTICKTNECIEIEQVELFKYLGITIDRRLSYKTHAEIISNELRYTLRHIYYLRNLCPKNVLINLYHSLVHSRIQYGITCWGGTYTTNLDPLIKIQKHVLRIISRKNQTHPSLPLFIQNKILPLRYLYIFKVLKLFFCRSGHKVIRQSKYFQRRDETCLVPFPYKENFRRYHLFIGPNIFNKLPHEIKIANRSTTFEKLLKNWLLSKNNVDELFNAVGNHHAN